MSGATFGLRVFLDPFHLITHREEEEEEELLQEEINEVSSYIRLEKQAEKPKKLSVSKSLT